MHDVMKINKRIVSILGMWQQPGEDTLRDKSTSVWYWKHCGNVPSEILPKSQTIFFITKESSRIQATVTAMKFGQLIKTYYGWVDSVEILTIMKEVVTNSSYKVCTMINMKENKQNMYLQRMLIIYTKSHDIQVKQLQELLWYKWAWK